MNENKHHQKESFLSSWAVDNRTTVYVLTFIIVLLGIFSFFSMPRESFPEVVQNNIYISTVYPGNSAEDVEKVITKELEDKFKNVSGVTKVTSNSFQDYCLIVVEFDSKLTVSEAKIRIKDKVDEAKGDQDWPNLDSGSKVEPSVFDLNISEELPILNINLKGNYPKFTLKQFAEERGFTADQVMALGDNFNDVSMLTYAGTSFAMGNAAPAIKEIANNVTDTNEENGVATAIDRILSE